MRVSDVPAYLRNGSFFQNLNKEDDDAFEVPENYIKNDPIVESLKDLKLLLRTTRFWGLAEMPPEGIECILRHADITDLEDLLLEFPELCKILQVKMASFADAVGTAIKLNPGLSVVRLMYQMGYATTAETCQEAAQVGDLESLMFLHKNECPWDVRTLIAAVRHDNCDCLQYALAADCRADDHLFTYAAYAGSVPALDLLMTHGLRWNEQTMYMAVAGRKLANIRYLVDAGCPLHPHACITASKNGDLDCLMFLHECGLELDVSCTVGAASHGHLSCLIYLHQQACPWEESCCEKAAFGGHLSSLKFFHENGCPWDYTASAAALLGGSWKCLWYILCHGGNVWVPLKVILNLSILLYVIVSALRKDRLQNDFSSSYAIDTLSIILPLCNVHSAVICNCHEYYTEYVSMKARLWYVVGFGLVVLSSLVGSVYSLYTCYNEAK